MPLTQPPILQRHLKLLKDIDVVRDIEPSAVLVVEEQHVMSNTLYDGLLLLEGSLLELSIQHFLRKHHCRVLYKLILD